MSWSQSHSYRPFLSGSLIGGNGCAQWQQGGGLTEWKRRSKKHACRFCGKGFVLQQDRDGHVNAVHLKTKPYGCDVCHMSFANKRYLVEHKKSHLELVGSS